MIPSLFANSIFWFDIYLIAQAAYRESCMAFALSFLKNKIMLVEKNNSKNKHKNEEKKEKKAVTKRLIGRLKTVQNKTSLH